MKNKEIAIDGKNQEDVYFYGRALYDNEDVWLKGDVLYFRTKVYEKFRKVFPEQIILELIEKKDVSVEDRIIQIDTEQFLIDKLSGYAKKAYEKEIFAEANKYSDKTPAEKKEFCDKVFVAFKSINKVMRTILIEEIYDCSKKKFPKAALNEQFRNFEKQQKKESQKLVTDGKSFNKAIQMFTDKRDLARKFLEIQPLFYDESKIFWLWDFETNCYKMHDETHILNQISANSIANTIESKEKNEILESLRQVGRENKPLPLSRGWIQFKNKIVDIKTCQEYEPSPDYFCTNPIPHEVGSTQETPVIDTLLEEWVGSEYILTLKEIISYCMLADYPIHRIFCFLGTGRNGKSRFLELIERVIGEENVAACELDNLMSNRFESFNMYKKLAVQMGETNFSTMRRTAVLKQLSGGDKVSFEAKNKNPIQDKSYAKLLISTNNLPETDDKSDGFFRRWLCIDFPNQFPEGKDVLEQIPDSEYEAFCAQSINILNQLLTRGGFTNEGTVQERQQRYEDRSNPIDKFVKDNCYFDENAHIFKYDFRKKLEEWCLENRHRKPTDMSISKNMKRMDVTESKESTQVFSKESNDFDTKYYRAWVGIGWKNEKKTQDKLSVQIDDKKEMLKIFLQNVDQNNYETALQMFGKDYIQNLITKGDLYQQSRNTLRLLL